MPVHPLISSHAGPLVLAAVAASHAPAGAAPVLAAAVPERPNVAVVENPSALPASLREVRPTGQVRLHVREGHLLQLPRAAAKVLVADPTVASFQVPSPGTVFVFAQAVGSTTLYALDANDQVVAAVRVVAEHNLQALREQIVRSVPGADITLEPATNSRVLVRGKVRTPLEAKQVVDQIQAFLDSTGRAGGGGAAPAGAGSTASGVVNQLQVELSSQINIQVRVVEVSRALSHELGFNWSSVLSTGRGNLSFGVGNAAGLFTATGTRSMAALMPASSTAGAALGGFQTRGRFSIGSLITAMSSQGLATLLAEPNLTAMSGESAAFAAGGEVPIVIITNNNVQIDFKSYGVILRMTPTLLSADRISLHIAPEVSELSEDGAVTLEGGSTIPAFKVRRADTTVELASGQSFALAGMLRSTSSQQITGVPGLSSIPWVGRLFEHEATKRDDTELVILVTANVVDPVSAGELQLPGRGLPAIDQHQPTQAAIGYLY